MAWIVYLAILGSLVLYFMTAEERRRLLGWLLRGCHTLWSRARSETLQRWTGRPDRDRRPVAPLPVVTGLIVMVDVCVFAGMLFGPGAFAEHATLVSWGGSVGPRTTNGEWWRLFTAIFVHSGPLEMLAMLAGFIQIGVITERLVGRLAFGCVYLAVGMLANVVCLFTSSVVVTAGSAASILGVYGLFAATWTWSLLRGSRIDIPWRTAKRFAPGIVFFLVYVVMTGRLDGAAGVAACAGAMIQGLLLAVGAMNHKPKLGRVAILTIDTVALVALFAVPLRGMADVRPVIDRVITTESRTASAYESAVARFRNGKIPLAGLVRLIDDGIRPELQAAAADVLELERVPADREPLVATADQYLRLRDESWRRRSEALRSARTYMLKEADRMEWEALEVLSRLKSMNEK